jgi:hypothetical protein
MAAPLVCSLVNDGQVDFDANAASWHAGPGRRHSLVEPGSNDTNGAEDVAGRSTTFAKVLLLVGVQIIDKALDRLARGVGGFRTSRRMSGPDDRACDLFVSDGYVTTVACLNVASNDDASARDEPVTRPELEMAFITAEQVAVEEDKVFVARKIESIRVFAVDEPGTCSTPICGSGVPLDFGGVTGRSTP